MVYMGAAKRVDTCHFGLATVVPDVQECFRANDMPFRLVDVYPFPSRPTCGHNVDVDCRQYE